LPEVITIGNQRHAVTVTEVLAILEDTRVNINVNLLGIPLADRPLFFAQLLPNLQAMRTRTGRPHWIVLDEAHHLLPKDLGAGAPPHPEGLTNIVYVTVAPEMVATQALRVIDRVIGMGEDATQRLAAFARAARKEPPPPAPKLKTGEALIWRPGSLARRFTVSETRFRHRRHRRKYAEGDLGPDFSFYFRGPEGKLNLRAQNLVMFAQIGAGLDAETWRFHLKRGDYARWFRDVVKDEELAEEAERLRRRRLSPEETRDRLLAAVNLRYTASSNQLTPP
jgi:hypothetical protein